MAIDLNMDMGDIVAALKSGGDGNSYTVFAFAANGAIIVAALGAALLWHHFYYTPKQVTASELQEEYDVFSQKAQEMPQMEQNITRMKRHVTDHKTDYIKTLDRFFDGTQIDTAFQHVSSVAKDTDMIVLAVKKGRALPKNAQSLVAEDTLKHITVMPVPVSVRLKGSYPDYLRFRTAMQEGEPFYTVTSDNLALTADKRYFGYIEADITLTAYTMDKDAIVTALADY